MTPMVYTPFADLDLLYGEEEQDVQAELDEPAADEPETVDAFNAQLLAGLVSP
jgi:hypothetical protein